MKKYIFIVFKHRGEKKGEEIMIRKDHNRGRLAIALLALLLLAMTASSFDQRLKWADEHRCSSCEKRAEAASAAREEPAADTGLEPPDPAVLQALPADAPPGAVTLLSPTGILSTGRPTYEWTKDPVAAFYHLVVNTSSGSTVLSRWYRASELSGATCSVTPLETLGPGSYTWRIQALNCEGSAWSEVLAFVVCTSVGLPQRATLVSPKGIIGTGTPTFVWNPVAGATRYRLKVVDITAPATPLIDRWYDAEEVLVDGRCSIISEVPLPEGPYRWWIQTGNCKGDGPWSYLMSFRFVNRSPGRPTAISPRGLISTRDPLFIWTAVPGAVRYHIQVNDTNDNIIIDGWYDAEEVTSGNRCRLRSPLTLPDEDMDYFWRVQASNDAGDGPWSSLRYFEVVCGGFSQAGGKGSGPATRERMDRRVRSRS